MLLYKNRGAINSNFDDSHQFFCDLPECSAPIGLPIPLLWAIGDELQVALELPPVQATHHGQSVTAPDMLDISDNVCRGSAV